MESLMLKYIIGGVFAVISYFGGKLVSKIFPIESKFFAGITGAVFLGIFLFIIVNLISGSNTEAQVTGQVERALYFFCALVAGGGYFGFLSNFKKETESNQIERTGT